LLSIPTTFVLIFAEILLGGTRKITDYEIRYTLLQYYYPKCDQLSLQIAIRRIMLWDTDLDDLAEIKRTFNHLRSCSKKASARGPHKQNEAEEEIKGKIILSIRCALF
jgi:hypothetical protein